MKEYRLSRLRDPRVIRRIRRAGGWPSFRVVSFAELSEELDVDMRGPAVPEPEKPPAWRKLVDLEPRLLELAKRALEADATREDFCANAVWHGYGGHRGLKPPLAELVGWGAAIYAPPLLKTSRAYDVAYETGCQALPDCKQEGLIC